MIMGDGDPELIEGFGSKGASEVVLSKRAKQG